MIMKDDENYSFRANKPSRDESAKKTSEVGKKVFEILSKPVEMQEVGETLEAMTPKYMEELFATASFNKNKLDSPFYIVVLRKKEPWALNVLRQWYIARQTKPLASFLRRKFPNHDHDVYLVNSKTEEVMHLWTLPTAQDSSTILKHKDMYHSDLVKWIQQFESGNLK